MARLADYLGLAGCRPVVEQRALGFKRFVDLFLDGDQVGFRGLLDEGFDGRSQAEINRHAAVLAVDPGSREGQ